MTITMPPVHRVVVAVALLAIGGCRDAPTMPDPLQQIAGGEAWVAIPEPPSLASLDALLPYVSQGPAAAPVAPRLRAFAAAARKARMDGRLDRAAELDREALHLAVSSLERAPEPALLFAWLGSLADWSDQVEAGVDVRVYPEVGSSLRLVQRSGDAALEAMERGDTTAAVLSIMQGSEAVRAHGPTTTALRVLDRTESRLREHEGRREAVERAIHLIRSARQELLAGDASRALRRALYALQLVEGRQVVDTPVRQVR